MSKVTNLPGKERRMAQGAEVRDGGVHFRVWAPMRRQVEIVLDGGLNVQPMTRDKDGHWSLWIPGIGEGTRYQYRLDRDLQSLPDPAARFLPLGPHGPAEVVDPRAFAWTDVSWTGPSLKNAVLYEMHFGTFTPEGTFAAAIEKIAAVKELGVTIVEIMPVSEFPGHFGWGYDGVAWFAPSHLYGVPDDFRRFVDYAHFLGLGVILDVVYNHLGPDGNYLEHFSPYYLSKTPTEWGKGLNFDEENCEGMRRLVIDNAAYWIDEFHLDGLRLDATQSILDSSKDHIIAALTREARARASSRRVLITAENEPQDSRLIRSPESGGLGLDALWNDDFHHSVVVSLTGRRQAYYNDYQGTANEWVAAAEHGFLFQGQRLARQGKARGQSTRGLPSAAFIAFLENHDQISNSFWSARLWQQSNPGCYRAMTALLLLGPWTPLLFQGQEWNTSTPFHYFADHQPELAKLVRSGRNEFMSQFPGYVTEHGLDHMLDPASSAAFKSSKLRWNERSLLAHQQALRLHQQLLTLRREDPTLRDQGDIGIHLETATLTQNCGVFRYFVASDHPDAQAKDRLLIINLGPGLDILTSTEPLLSPPDQSSWRLQWSSEASEYGGYGCQEPLSEQHGWHIPGCAAVLLRPL